MRLDLGHCRQRLHLHARRQHHHIDAFKVHAGDDARQVGRVVTGHGEVVGDFQRAPVLHLEAFLADVVHHQLGQRLHVRCDDGNALGLHHMQGLDQRPGAGDHRCQRIIVGGGLLQALFRLAVIAQHIDLGVGQLDCAAVGLGVHRGQFFLLHLLHAHAAGMEGEPLGADRLACVEHRRNFGFHGGVRTRHDLADAV
ncbi:hypothetical protein D3C75_936540 [compost metagenome]